MENDLISIVVPIYKVEKYLEQCIRSIINQTYQNIEIILVDDGSPDNCGKMCDDYATKDGRIKVIHKQNGGLSDARNHGIEAATGKYITFVDSDDYIDEKYIEELHNAIKTNNVKVSQCGILHVNDEKQILKKSGHLEKQLLSGKQMLKDLYKDHGTENIVVWNKMYDIQLFKNIRYPVGKIHEDEFTIYKIFYDVENVAILNKYYYNYRQNENSITGKKFNIKRLDKIEAYEQRLEFFKQKNENELYQLALMSYLLEVREAYMNTKKYIDNSKDIQLGLVKKYRANYKFILIDKNVRIMKKLKMLIFFVSPEMFYILKK